LSNTPILTHFQMLQGLVLRSNELEKIVGTRQAIRRAVNAGMLHQVCRGLYSVGELIPRHKALFVVLGKYYPDAIISQKSAMVFQELLDESLDKIDLDVPREDNPPRKHEFYNFNRKATLIGWEEKEIEGRKIRVYSRERCLFEALSIDGYSGELFHKVLLRYCKGDINLKAIEDIGETLKGSREIITGIRVAQAANNKV